MVSSPRGVVVMVPVLVLSAASSAIFLSSSYYPKTTTFNPRSTAITTTGEDKSIVRSTYRISATAKDITWLKDQIQYNMLHMQQNILRKGINPCTSAQQLQDLNQFKAECTYPGDRMQHGSCWIAVY